MNKYEYFQNLCDRVFDLQEKYGIIEPLADHFPAVLVQSDEVADQLSANGVNMVALKTMLNSMIVLQPTTHQGQ